MPDSKYLTANFDIVAMPVVSDYYLALSQHIGAPAEAVVKAGDKVIEGQVIAVCKGFGANVHSPICGEVVGIVSRPITGGVADHIHIRPNGGNDVFRYQPLSENCTVEEIITRVAEAGIVGLGGAGFPTAIKLQPSKPIDILVVNAVECEPYLNKDNRLMIEHSKEITKGIQLVAKALSVNNIVVGIEDNKQGAYSAMSQCGDMRVEYVKQKYPQGGEKMLIKALLNREVPVGKLPMDAGVVVINVGTAYAIYDAVVNGNTLYTKVITVTGQGIVEPKNILVKNGTPWQDIVDFCGGVKDDAVKLINGGPMMGHAMNSLDIAVKKADSGLLVLSKLEVDNNSPTTCIKCSACVDHCPMHLLPYGIDFNTTVGDTDSAVKCGALNCIECGVCAYVCPAKRPIVQSARLTKMRARGKK